MKSYNYGLEENLIKTGRRGGDALGWSHTHMWQIKISRDISGAKGPCPTPGPPSRVPAPGREVSITSGCKNQ